MQQDFFGKGPVISVDDLPLWRVALNLSQASEYKIRAIR